MNKIIYALEWQITTLLRVDHIQGISNSCVLRALVAHLIISNRLVLKAKVQWYHILWQMRQGRLLLLVYP